ncbi:MAG TPA: hypothetical protein VGE16_00270 [Albitalea sp.]
MNQALRAAVGAACLAALAACTVRPPPATIPSPADVCKALNEALIEAVPPGESLAELQARGVRVRTPLNFAPGTMPASQQASGAAVRLLINADGTVVPGSPRIVKSVGEPQMAAAMEAAALSMTFDLDPAVKPAAPIPFTAIHAACARS